MASKNNNQDPTDVSSDEYYPLDKDPELARLSNEDPDITTPFLGYTSLAGQLERDSNNPAKSEMLELAEEHLLLVLQNKGYGRTKKPDGTGLEAN